MKYTKVILAALVFIPLLTVLLAGCVHDFPTMTDDGEQGVDPTLVQVNTEVTLDLEFLPLTAVVQKTRQAMMNTATGNATDNATGTTTNATTGTTDNTTTTSYRRRFIVEVRRDGQPEARQVTVMENAEEDYEQVALPISLKLHAVEYTLVVWTDYVKAGTTEDLYYDTTNMQQIYCIPPYTGSTDYRDCLYGTASLDLRSYRDEWNARVQVNVEMVRPLAKYEIIATDVKDFLRRMKKKQRNGEGDATYTIAFAYGFYLPTGFNVLTGKPGTSLAGVQYSMPLTVPTDGTEELLLGSDYVFVNGTESFVQLSMEIRDATGTVVSRTTGLKVPYRRGHLTTMRSNFLTNEMQGGVEIDPDFEGSIDVDLDGLLQ